MAIIVFVIGPGKIGLTYKFHFIDGYITSILLFTKTKQLQMARSAFQLADLWASITLCHVKLLIVPLFIQQCGCFSKSYPYKAIILGVHVETHHPTLLLPHNYPLYVQVMIHLIYEKWLKTSKCKWLPGVFCFRGS